MDGRMLVGLLAVTACVESQPAALAAGTEEKGHTYGHATFTYRVSCTAEVDTNDGQSSGQDTLTIKFTETQKCKLDRFPNNPKFATYLESWKSNVSVAGRGKYVPNDPEIQPSIWHCETGKQFEDCVCSWFNGTFGAVAEDLGFDWDASIAGPGGPMPVVAVKIVQEQGAGGGAPAFSSAGLAFVEGTGGSTEEMKVNVILRKEPAPLEWWFVLPEDLSKPITCTAHKTYTGGTDLSPGDTGSTTITVDYNFHFLPPGCTEPEKPKVELQEIDQEWLPKGDDVQEDHSVTATVNVNGDKSATGFQFRLYDVSKEPGTCCNSDDANTDPDLSFAPDQGGWKVEPGDGNWVATSDDGGKSASIRIACHDWGAWGKLAAQAKIEGKWEPAKVAGSGLDYVRIPYDDDDDHIADSWQADEDVAGKAPKDDSGKKPTDQANDGDGLSVYECYRGFEVLDANGMSGQVRLKPLEKTLFVLDLSGYFDEGLWKQSSGITSYLVGQRGCRIKTWADAARLVNFRSSNAKNGDKYCVVITPIKGPYKDAGGDFPLGVTNGPGGGCPGAPRDVDSLYVYPDNMRFWLETVSKQLQTAMADPDSPVAQEFENLGLPHRMWRDAADRLKQEASVQKLVAQTMRQTAIHEMGHACGLAGHVEDKSDPQSREGLGLGNQSCPMHYSDRTEDLRYLILQVLLKPDAAMPMAYGQFCKDADYNCWGHLNVKDN